MEAKERINDQSLGVKGLRHLKRLIQKKRVLRIAVALVVTLRMVECLLSEQPFTIGDEPQFVFLTKRFL